MPRNGFKIHKAFLQSDIHLGTDIVKQLSH